MNYSPRWRDAGKLALIDELLVDIAVRIQLTPTHHDDAVDHYLAINNHLDREDSPLHGRVSRFYPQGSMAIGATIRSGDDDDIFDIDLVAELDLPGKTPDEVLDLLFEAINGPKGSRYHGLVERQSRCVTVYYADMHLDVTPLFRNPSWKERGGHICHAKPEEHHSLHKFVAANPWGFADWFTASTPADDWFREMVLEKSTAQDARLLSKAAPAEPVPDRQNVFAKPLVVVALQLTKRWARLRHLRSKSTGRCVPSVVMSRSFAMNAGHANSLIDELIYQTGALYEALRAATAAQQVVDWRNPSLDEDNLTDRWPGDIGTQWEFAESLAEFNTKLQGAKQIDDIEELQALLIDLFGERTSRAVIGDFYKRAGTAVSQGGSRVAASTGAALAGLSRAPAVATVASPSHRFFGD